MPCSICKKGKHVAGTAADHWHNIILKTMPVQAVSVNPLLRMSHYCSNTAGRE